ncbi:hypothetical protein VSDG_09801 [Cytospora chrysosperma]|uniref:Uncharacterized protein n=1 Tax=Cytospora chrysosperma TaxID=252740 RepID=A0A423V9D6_CYTCH|nr:hypothetical protein VSDG_09801 [Valsa sordida]
MPDQTLAGKVAIVTGSNTGIGAAIAQELSSRGASIVVNYPFPGLAGEAQDVVASLPTAPSSIAVEADLSSETGPQQLIDATVAKYGDTIHILVNNAGLAVNKPLPQQTLDDWNLLVNLNARAVFLLGMVDSMTKVWAKELPPRYGCTVNAVSPGPTMTAGFAAAGEEFMREMAPVMAQTPVGHRMAQPEEIAFGVGFLCEPRASWINGLHLVASGGLHID